MSLHKLLLTGTALASGLLAAGTLPAVAGPMIPLGGYTGQVQINYQNFESFLNSAGAVVGTPSVGAQNFGVFDVLSITPLGGSTPLWQSGTNGDVLVGVFNGIKVATSTGPLSARKTTNTGGVFQLYLVPKAQFTSVGGFHQGTGGYAAAGCAIASLCYNGVTNTAGGALVLTMDLVPGIDGPTATLTASVDETTNPPSGQAFFDSHITGDPQFGLNAFGGDSFCPNTTGCKSEDGSTFALASQDPITATVVPVPEPASLAIFGSTLLGLGAMFGWRRRNKST